jgi:septal ring factor EnvC (AmiA/AmiB activator)
MLKDSSPDKNKLIISLLVVVLVMLLINNFFNIKDSDKIDYLKNEIKKVNVQIDAVYDENKILQSKMEDFKTEIREIDNGIEINNNKIQNLNNYEKEQVSSFATYGNVEWEKYFADRYKQ